MQIELKSEYCKISLEKNGVKKQKLVSLGDLMDELSAYRATNFGLLPRNLRIMESQGNMLLMGLEFPRSERSITLSKYGFDRDIEEIVDGVQLPAGVFFIKLLRQPGGVLRHVDSFMYAIRGKRISFSSDRLYRYPTPNIYDNGRVCWGSVEIADMVHLSSVERLVNSFFSNNFNSDLFSGKVSEAFPGSRNADRYFSDLTKEEFKDEWLVQTNYTVGSIAAKLLKGDF